MGNATKDAAVRTMLAGTLGEVAAKADAVVVIAGTGSVLLRPTGEEGMLEQPGHTVEIAYAYPDGKDGRRVVRKVSVKTEEKPA